MNFKEKQAALIDFVSNPSFTGIEQLKFAFDEYIKAIPEYVLGTVNNQDFTFLVRDNGLSYNPSLTWTGLDGDYYITFDIDGFHVGFIKTDDEYGGECVTVATMEEALATMADVYGVGVTPNRELTNFKAISKYKG